MSVSMASARQAFASSRPGAQGAGWFQFESHFGSSLWLSVNCFIFRFIDLVGWMAEVVSFSADCDKLPSWNFEMRRVCWKIEEGCGLSALLITDRGWHFASIEDLRFLSGSMWMFGADAVLSDLQRARAKVLHGSYRGDSFA